MLWLRPLKWYHGCWYSIARKRKGQWLMLQVHQCVAAIGGGFDAGAEERRRTCSIDPWTQPVLILRQSSFQLVSVAVWPSSAYSRAGSQFFFYLSFFASSLATPVLYVHRRFIARLLLLLLPLPCHVLQRRSFFGSSLFEGNSSLGHMDCEARGLIEGLAWCTVQLSFIFFLWYFLRGI